MADAVELVTPGELLAFFDRVVAEDGDSARQLHVYVAAAAGPASTDVAEELLGGAEGSGRSRDVLEGMASVAEWKQRQTMHETLV